MLSSSVIAKLTKRSTQFYKKLCSRINKAEKELRGPDDVIVLVLSEEERENINDFLLNKLETNGIKCSMELTGENTKLIVKRE